MKDIFIFLFFTSIIVSCTSYDEMLEALDRKHGIDKLKKGMVSTKVEEIVGKPYRKKYTQDSTEVWIYITGIPQTAFSQSPEDLSNDYKTVVIFKDKMLIGWGEDYKDMLIN